MRDGALYPSDALADDPQVGIAVHVLFGKLDEV
jgi:hypothetical protein